MATTSERGEEIKRIRKREMGGRQKGRDKQSREREKSTRRKGRRERKSGGKKERET